MQTTRSGTTPGQSPTGTNGKESLRQGRHGFTLVELAIVITIIGLLIGGVLKGQEMIQNARVTATIAQVQSYQAAIETFRDRFEQLPGDMSTATFRLPGCTAAHFCFNGNGNSIIGRPNVSASVYQGGTATAPNVETSLFWKHLALADVIAGINPAANPESPAWGQTHASAAIGGGYHIFHRGIGGVNRGHMFSLQLPVNAPGYPHPAPGQGALSPIHAAQIDRKMDDGRSGTGFVFAGTAAGNGIADTDPRRCVEGTTERNYANITTKNCLLYFVIF